MEVFVGAVEEAVEQWGCENPYVIPGFGNRERLRFLHFLRRRNDIVEELSISDRINEGKGKSALYIVDGDLGHYDEKKGKPTHDGRHFPLGKSEGNFLSQAPINWTYFIRYNKTTVFDRLWEVGFALSSTTNQDTLLQLKPEISKAEIKGKTLTISITIQHPADEVSVLYAESRDKVRNAPGVIWREKELA